MNDGENKMDSQTYKDFLTDSTVAPLLGQEMLRDDLLPALLGNKVHELSYWAGKRLARSHQLKQLDDLPTFFTQFKLGNLKKTKQTNTEILWLLNGPIVASRISHVEDIDFYLEAGIIAQNIGYALKLPAEAQVGKISKAKGSVVIATQLGNANDYRSSINEVELELIKPESNNQDSATENQNKKPME
ncbi:DUF2507 domain-containing protein [Lentilactobacillus kribbianus]|uniref:DUF2507 domain-containing protein n=1 Tax=Lentilactobacillus kribbianus TaxID=2729622 RepID=UPI0015572F36|nr:DUF2507 domain-containing protein [Lentilactobacillus kribbianus]